MNEKKYRWHKIAGSEKEINWPENGIAVVELNGKKICLTKWKEEFYSFAYSCPHAGGLLSLGDIDAAGNIICPVHGYRFSIQNGRNSSGEGFYLRHWPAERRADGIYIRMEDTGIFGSF